jgi:hypothetical protein
MGLKQSWSTIKRTVIWLAQAMLISSLDWIFTPGIFLFLAPTARHYHVQNTVWLLNSNIGISQLTLHSSISPSVTTAMFDSCIYFVHHYCVPFQASLCWNTVIIFLDANIRCSCCLLTVQFLDHPQSVSASFSAISDCPILSSDSFLLKTLSVWIQNG